MKKLKYQYQQSIKAHPHDYFWKKYPNLRSVYFKKFSTQQERSFYFMHCIELNIKTIRSKYVLPVVVVCPMFGMISRLMSINFPKVGSTIPNGKTSTIKNMRNEST